MNKRIYSLLLLLLLTLLSTSCYGQKNKNSDNIRSANEFKKMEMEQKSELIKNDFNGVTLSEEKANQEISTIIESNKELHEFIDNQDIKIQKMMTALEISENANIRLNKKIEQLQSEQIKSSEIKYLFIDDTLVIHLINKAVNMSSLFDIEVWLEYDESINYYSEENILYHPIIEKGYYRLKNIEELVRTVYTEEMTKILLESNMFIEKDEKLYCQPLFAPGTEKSRKVSGIIGIDESSKTISYGIETTTDFENYTEEIVQVKYVDGEGYRINTLFNN